MGRRMFDIEVMVVWAVALNLCFFSGKVSADLGYNYYANTCPNVENIVRRVVTEKITQTFATIPGTLRVFFHDCFIQGCDASIMIASTADNTAEKDNPINLSLSGDGFDTVIKAKAAVEATHGCENKVSCADILAMAARDVVALAGGPFFRVLLGRLDGLNSTSSSVDGNLPRPSFNLDELTSIFASRGLSMEDMVALSGAHTVGFAHCNQFSNRIYNFSGNPLLTLDVDPLMNTQYLLKLRSMCPVGVDPRAVIGIDSITPEGFDNKYYTSLRQGKGLLSSDQVLYTDPRSRSFVDSWAFNPNAFQRAFVAAMTKLGRVGVKTGSQGNIRSDCSVFN